MSAYWRLVLALAVFAAIVWVWLLTSGGAWYVFVLLLAAGGWLLCREIELRARRTCGTAAVTR